MKDESKIPGAIARTQSLTPEERSAIARKAALARYGKDLPKAIAEGILKIGSLQLSCAVLDDAKNTRVLTQGGFLNAIGRASSAKGGEGASIDGKPAFLRAKNLEPFISNELISSTTPIEFIPLKGRGYEGRAFGYEGKLLPGVCWVYQEAMLARKLLPTQKHVGEACKELLKALTNYAIEDLIDQATGFDDVRKKAAILKIIERYVNKDALPWVKMFDLDFYRHIYRLNGWAFDPEKNTRPSCIGHWTNDIYDRFGPGIRPELHSRVKRNSRGRPTQKLSQYLNPEEGKPRLKELLEGVKALMRISTSWDDFMDKLNQAYPKFDEVPVLPFSGGLPRITKKS